jgi:serpin B
MKRLSPSPLLALLCACAFALACAVDPADPEGLAPPDAPGESEPEPDTEPEPDPDPDPEPEPDPGPRDPPRAETFLVRADLPRADPDVEDADLVDQVHGNTTFAFDLYARLRSEPGNLFLSPYSISSALAMAQAGAGGETDRQMRDTLGFVLPGDGHHAVFNALDQAFASRGEDQAGADGGAFRLYVNNALWAQAGAALHTPFLETLATWYGAGVYAVDFAGDAEETTDLINEWVAYQTEDAIPELFPDPLSGQTRFVLTNTVYFNAAWAFAFDEETTADRPFHRLDGTTVDVPTMRQTVELPLAVGDGWRLVEIPYAGETLSMVVVLPDDGRFDEIEAALDADTFDAMLEVAVPMRTSLALPRFTFSADFDLVPPLSALGMTDAFDPGLADFGGISPDYPDLFISFVVHHAFVDVNEAGTEAAGATGVGFEPGWGDGPPEMHVDRPFLFLIRDVPTGSVIFLGRVLDPSAGD